MSFDRWNGVDTPDDLPDMYEDDSSLADSFRDELADLDDIHEYPVTLSEGALFRRQAQ